MLNWVLLLVALGIILLGATVFTNGLEWFGKKMHLSDGAVGSVFAAVGTALPETLVPIVAIMFGTPEAGHKIGVLGITSFRPFPTAAIGEAVRDCERVVVVEKSFAVGVGGIVSRDVRTAMRNHPHPIYAVIAGLGGRAITKDSLHQLFLTAMDDKLEALTFLDLDWNAVNRELERERITRRSGPIAENLLRDLGVVAARVG